MPYLRSHLRRFATLWLCCQILSVCVLGATEFRHARIADATAGRECDSESGLCPIQAITGVPCPMHTANSASSRTCAIRGLCNSPAATLSALLTVPGTLVDRMSVDTVIQGALVPATSGVCLDVVIASDAPPPRA